MIKIEKTQVVGIEPAIRGMRNPMNSWDRSDSYWTHMEDPDTLEESPFQYFVGDADLDLMKKLSEAGSVHAKYLRMVVVYVDITAPLYWWKEFDTYKIGTTSNSCSTMHKIHSKEFTIDDFSCEHLEEHNIRVLKEVINALNTERTNYNFGKLKSQWWQMIQLLPSSYNQKRTITCNYEVLKNMYHSRKNHKLDEWHSFCDWVKGLPYSELIVGQGDVIGDAEGDDRK